jgi:hypothetical protein
LGLKKVHARLFVKLRQYDEIGAFIGNEKVDGYVLTHMTPPLRIHVASSHSESVQLRSPSSSKWDLYSSVLEISSPDIWDASRLAFLCCDDRPFEGYFKLNGKRLYHDELSFEDPEWNFYLAWGGLVLWDRDTNGSRKTVWVRLYSLEDWTRGPRKFADETYISADVDQPSEFETHELRLASLDVEVGVVSIEEQGRVFFRINIKVCSRLAISI